MKARLTLNNPLWRTTQRRKILDRAVQQSALELEGEIKRTILESTPRGRIYRRGSKGKRLHRASAPGQPPAVDTAGLINSIRAKKILDLKASVSTSKKYAPTLDDKQKLNRPFFAARAEKFKKKFKKNLAAAISENTP
jgi:hypothetical protein